MNLFPPPHCATAPPDDMGLPPLPKPLRTDMPVHWLGDDGDNVFIEVQGRFAAVAIRKGPLKYEREKRQEINGFSPASRLRLFKKINRLDFERTGRCTFVTGTWRDELGRPSPAEITLARSSWQRSFERIVGKNVSGVWRVEWQRRKSGKRKGQYMPHIHTLYFGTPFVAKEEVTRCWARAIGWQGNVSVKLQEIKDVRQVLYYVSKYIAKVEFEGNLDIPSYLSTHMHGRKWGIYRQELLPTAESVLIRVSNGELVKKIREIATKAYKGTPQNEEEGFCVLGDAAADIRALVDEYCLTHDSDNVQ